MLRPFAGIDRDDLAALLLERAGSLVRLRDPEVRELDLAAEVEPLGGLVGQPRGEGAVDVAREHVAGLGLRIGVELAEADERRVERRVDDKTDTFVLDFRNELEDVQASFAPYYERTEAVPTDPNPDGSG